MATQTFTATAIQDIDDGPYELQPVLNHDNTIKPLPAGHIAATIPAIEPPPLASSSNPPEPSKLSTRAAWTTILQLVSNAFINSFSAGVLLVALLTIASDLHLSQNLLLWPTSVTYFASASCQFIAGSIADVLGPKRPNSIGSFCQSVMIIATGFARNGTELIVFRALLGVASSVFTTSGRSILCNNIERGRLRNFAFAAMVLSFPLGAGLGLVIGGVYADKATWRVGYWSSGAVGLLLSVLGMFTLPPDHTRSASWGEARRRLATDIDWVWAVLAIASLAMLSYVMALLSARTEYIHRPTNAVLLAISLALIPAFAMWMQRRQKKDLPALVPNSLWKSSTFTSVCLMIALSNAAQQSLTLFVSLFFQEVQSLSAYQASIRLLPQAVVSALMCLLVGTFVNKVTPFLGIISTMTCASVAPLLMAVTNPAWPYWYTAFWAQVMAPLSIDVMFVVGALVIADAFPSKSQAKGAAVFGAFSQLGSSLGLCIMSVISNSFIDGTKQEMRPQALLRGYRASFWTQFAWILASAVIGAVGLRKMGLVGLKRD